MNMFRLLFVFSICLLISCTAHRSISEPPQLMSSAIEPGTRHDEIQIGKKAVHLASQISTWRLSGAMAAKNARKGWSASLDWTQHGLTQYQIRLLGPLGSGTILISRNGGIVTFTDGPKQITSSNADELLMQQTGIRLPVTNLYYWVRGIPAPGNVQSSQVDNYDNLIALMQGGYKISYGKYTVVNNVSLPTKILLEGHNVRIKLIIKQWNI